MSTNIFSIFEDIRSMDFSFSVINSIFFEISWSIFAMFSRPPILFNNSFISPTVLIISLIFISNFSTRVSISVLNLSRFKNSLVIF